tara:strand:- start:57 stop:878 length:822 start_codon:yes stop_codon:yes gene_type:complete
MSGVIQGSFGQRSGIIAENNMYTKPEHWQWKSTNIPNYDRPGESQYDVDGYTYSLIHAHPQNNYTHFQDVSCFGGNTTTGHGATKADTALGIMGPSGIAFDSNDDYIKVLQHKCFQGSQTSITVDFWMATNDAGSAAIFDARNNDSNALLIDHNDSDTMSVTWHGGTMVFDTPTNNDYKWHHVAFVRDTEGSSGGASRSYFFFDGTECVKASGAAFDHSMTGRMFSGQGHEFRWGENYPSTAGYGGFLAEMRVSVGIARWTSNFKVNKTTCKH